MYFTVRKSVESIAINLCTAMCLLVLFPRAGSRLGCLTSIHSLTQTLAAASLTFSEGLFRNIIWKSLNPILIELGNGYLKTPAVHVGNNSLNTKNIN